MSSSGSSFRLPIWLVNDTSQRNRCLYCGTVHCDVPAPEGSKLVATTLWHWHRHSQAHRVVYQGQVHSRLLSLLLCNCDKCTFVLDCGLWWWCRNWQLLRIASAGCNSVQQDIAVCTMWCGSFTHAGCQTHSTADLHCACLCFLYRYVSCTALLGLKRKHAIKAGNT